MAVVVFALAITTLSGAPADAQTCTTVLPGQSCPPPSEPSTTAPTTTLLPSTTTTTTERVTTTTTVPSTSTHPATTTTVRPTATTAAPPRTSQPATTTTTSPSLLVPGSAPDANGAGGRSVTGARASTTSEDRTGMVVAIVITGLLLVALLFSLITWRFWRNTRPVPAAEPTDEPTAEHEPVGAHG
jgi:cobalamin biosynthesis Mg chelatase CobN